MANELNTGMDYMLPINLQLQYIPTGIHGFTINDNQYINTNHNLSSGNYMSIIKLENIDKYKNDFYVLKNCLLLWRVMTGMS